MKIFFFKEHKLNAEDARDCGPRPGPEIQKSLSASWKEGISASVMIGIIDYYLIPFALLLGATPQQVGFVVAIPNLFAALSQLMAVRFLHWAGSRVRLLILCVGIQGALLVPLSALAMVGKGSWEIYALIFLITAHKVLGHLIGPAWGSLISDYLPVHQRGGYLGRRQQVCGFAGIAGVCFWGSVLAILKRFSPEVGFAAIFLGAAAFRSLSYYYMNQMVDLPLRFTRESHFTFWMFLRRFKESNFVKFVFFVASLTFSAQLAAPYFSVYMLKELEFGYMAYTVMSMSAVVAGLLSFPMWGRHADVVGNARILKTTSLLIPLIPLLWVVSTSRVYLFFVEAFGGFVWAGFNLCATNFIYDAVSPDKRVRCLGYFSLINGAAIFAGATLGGYLAERLPPLAGSSFCTLFVLSGGGRLLGTLFLSRQFKEVRASTPHVSSMDLFFSVVGIHPVASGNDLNTELLGAVGKKSRSWTAGWRIFSNSSSGKPKSDI